MRKRIPQKVLLLIYLCLNSIGISQSNHLYYHQNPNKGEEGVSIEISQLLFIQDQVLRGTLFFRDKGEISYQEIIMSFESGKWIGIIPGDRVTSKGIEYLTILTKKNGGKIALPLVEEPFENPLFISVSDKIFSKKGNNDNIESSFSEADVLILSPEDGAVLRPEEIVISASLFNAPNVDPRDFKVFINDIDYTDQTIISGGVLSLVPENGLDFGFHNIKLMFKTTYGMPIEPLKWSFSTSKGAENIIDSFKYNGSLFAKRTSSSASSITIDEKQYTGKINAELNWIKAKYSFRTSSRESKLAQPINRSTLSLRVTDYLTINNGDVFPSISPYIIDGKKVKGRHVEVNLKFQYGFKGIELFGKNRFAFDFNGNTELQTVSGLLVNEVQYRAGIDNAYELVDYIDSLNLHLFDRKGYTFPREINASRLSLSLNNQLKAGLHFLKAKDNFSKIRIRAPETSLFTVDSSNFGIYTLAQFINSINNTDTVKIKKKNWSDGNPQENLVFGFDLERSLDNRKLLFQMGWNTSLTNYNIWAGTAVADSLDLMADNIEDSLFLAEYDEDGLLIPNTGTPVNSIGEFIEDYQDFFTIHPLYMSPIVPIDPIMAQKSTLKAVVNMPASAYYIRVKGSYAFNNILIEYKHLGPEYKSFGNPYLTNDMREFSINDRLSLLGRRLMFVLGYSSRDNKTSELVINPITTKTISLNTTLVPGPGAPSFILRFQSIGKTNGVDTLDVNRYGVVLGDSRENSQALNIMASVNFPGDFKYFSTITSLNLNSINYSDNLASERGSDYFFQKSNTQSISATISTRFNLPIKTTTSFNQAKIFTPYLDENEIAKEEISTWTSFSSSVQYSLFNNKLRFRGGLDYTTNGKSDDLSMKLYGGKIGADWDILDKLTLNFNSSMRLNNNKVYKNDNIDNDQDGKIDEKSENWLLNSSGFNLSLGYRF